MFLKINVEAKIIVHEMCFGNYFSKSKLGKMNYIGLDKKLENSKRIIRFDDKYVINDRLTLIIGLVNIKMIIYSINHYTKGKTVVLYLMTLLTKLH